MIFELHPPSNTNSSWQICSKHAQAASILAQFPPALKNKIKSQTQGVYLLEEASTGAILEELVLKRALLYQGKHLHGDLFTPMKIVHQLVYDQENWIVRVLATVGRTTFYLDQALFSSAGRWVIHGQFFYKISMDTDKRAIFANKVVSVQQAQNWINDPSSYEGLADLVIDGSSLHQKPVTESLKPIFRLSDSTLRSGKLAWQESGTLRFYDPTNQQTPKEVLGFVHDLKELEAQWSASKQQFNWSCDKKAQEALHLLIDCGWQIQGPRAEPVRQLAKIHWNHLKQIQGSLEAEGEIELQQTQTSSKPARLPLGPLAHYLRNELKLVPLVGGELMLLPVTPGADLLALKHSEPQGSKVKWKMSQLDWALSIQAQSVDFEVQQWQQLSHLRHKNSSHVNEACQEHLPIQLRPYQQQAVVWLKQLSQMGLGGILADEMGLGKTIQILAFLKSWNPQIISGQAHNCHLIVVPRSLLSQWQTQIERFFGPNSVHLYHGSQRYIPHSSNPNLQIWLTTYQILASEISWFNSQKWQVVVFDESHMIRNPQSQGYRAGAAVHCLMKIAVTGTPIFNSLQDLWSQLALVAPSIVDLSQISANGELSSLNPLWLRRTKQQVASELPEKIEEIVWLDMDEAQAELYERLLRSEQKLQADQTLTRLQVLEKILRLRQCCLLPQLIEPTTKVIGVKQEQLLQDLDILLSEERSVLVFSQFSQVLQPMYERACQLGLHCHYIDSKTSQREQILNNFSQGQPSALFMTLGTGGVGLNLTRASAVILLDPWWNEAAENQAIDRAHRLGQQRGVDVRRYIIKGSLEEAMLEIKASKSLEAQAWAESSLSGPQNQINDLDEVLWHRLVR